MDRSTAEIYGWLVSAVAVALMVVPFVVAAHIDGWLRAGVCFFSVFYMFGIIEAQRTVVERIWSKVEE